MTSPGAVLTNGSITLGVNPEGHLNVLEPPNPVPSQPEGTLEVGLRYEDTTEALSHGCLCEGWGIQIPEGTGSASVDMGVNGLSLASFTSTGSTARSTVTVAGSLVVTHAFEPSAVPSLYRITVTLQNTTSHSLSGTYRRVMDWDVEPTAYSEFVTIQGASPQLHFSSNDGFANPDPSAGPIDAGATGTFIDYGPQDQGAVFDFSFGPIAPGGQEQFFLYYGAAPTEQLASEAVQQVGAEVFSFAQSRDGQTTGQPVTFIFAYGRPTLPSCEQRVWKHLIDTRNSKLPALRRSELFKKSWEVLAAREKEMRARGDRVSLGGIMSLLEFEALARVAHYNTRCVENSYVQDTTLCEGDPISTLEMTANAPYSNQYGLGGVHTSNFHPCADISSTGRQRDWLLKLLKAHGLEQPRYNVQRYQELRQKVVTEAIEHGICGRDVRAHPFSVVDYYILSAHPSNQHDEPTFEIPRDETGNFLADYGTYPFFNPEISLEMFYFSVMWPWMGPGEYPRLRSDLSLVARYAYENQEKQSCIMKLYRSHARELCGTEWSPVMPPGEVWSPPSIEVCKVYGVDVK